MRNYCLLFVFILIPLLSFGQNESLDDFVFYVQNQNNNAVIKFDKTEVTLLKINEMRIRKERTIEVFNESGNVYVNNYIHYDKNTKIKSYGAEIYDENGGLIKKLKKKDYKDASAVDGGTLYADDRVIYSDYTPNKYPYTIHYFYEYETSNTLFLPNWTPITTYNLGVELGEYHLTNLSEIPIRVKEKNFDSLENIEKKETENGFSYFAKRIYPIREEAYSPSFDQLVPILMTSPERFELEGRKGKFSNWKEFGMWMNDELLKDKRDLTEFEKNHVLKLVEGVEDIEERVRIIYQYMQDKTRYISVQVGIGGWMPTAADQVSNKGYGDCKGLTNYMIALLEAIDISSNYTIVYGNADQKQHLETDFASLQGNHVILNVPTATDTLWLECTSQQIAFNQLGNFTADRWALSVDESGGEIVKTKSYPDSLNTEKVVANVNIDTDGNLKLDYSKTTKGIQYHWTYGVANENNDNQLAYLKKYHRNLNNLSILDYELINDKNKGIYTQKVNLEANAYGQKIGNRLIVDVLPITKYKTSLSSDNNRQYPLEIPYGFIDEATYTYNLPAGFNLKYKIEDVNLVTPFGKYLLTSETKNNQLIIHRKLEIYELQHNKELYNDYVSFRKAIQKSDNLKVLFEKVQP